MTEEPVKLLVCDINDEVEHVMPEANGSICSDASMDCEGREASQNLSESSRFKPLQSQTPAAGQSSGTQELQKTMATDEATGNPGEDALRNLMMKWGHGLAKELYISEVPPTFADELQKAGIQCPWQRGKSGAMKKCLRSLDWLEISGGEKEVQVQSHAIVQLLIAHRCSSLHRCGKFRAAGCNS